MKTLLRLFLLVTLCGLPLACNQPNRTVLKTPLLTPDNSQIQAINGRDFEVVLPSLGAGAQYQWVLQGGYDESLIQFSEEKEAPSEYPAQAPLGYAPNRIFVFKTLAVGLTDLVFTQEPIGDQPAVTTQRSFSVQVLPSQTTIPTTIP